MPTIFQQVRHQRRERNVQLDLDTEAIAHDVGRMSIWCTHCGAFRWKAENQISFIYITLIPFGERGLY